MTASVGGGTVFKLMLDGTGYTVLYNFGAFPDDGANPSAALVQASDGALYGTTSAGGSSGAGTVFKLNADGTGYTVVHNFGSIANDGANPSAALVQASDGALYGTTSAGGSSGAGTVFKLNPGGSGYTVLYNFGSFPDDGANPSAALVQASDGALYGTTYVGGSSSGFGTVFKLNLDGTGYTVLYNFGSIPHDGANPSAALVQASNGALYGTTYIDIDYLFDFADFGRVFKLNPDGTGYTMLLNFASILDEGASPSAALVQASDGALYGTTQSVSGKQCGAPLPEGPLTGSVFKLNADGTDYKVLYNFGSTPTDGLTPSAAVVQASDGPLYGTTLYGGNSYAGTVFKLNLDGTGYTVLYNFGSIADDGANPSAALVQASNGALYGTTSAGGSSGAGTVFRLNLDGTGYTVLYNFGSIADDGANPSAALVQASDGALYGTTSVGGSSGAGTVFKLNADGTGYTVVHNFGSIANDGANPSAALVQANDGALYGTTSAGGSTGVGTVFKLNLDGTGYTVLYNFGLIPNDGAEPRAALVQASDGALYGTSVHGGSGSQGGTVFKLNLDGTGYTVLYNFGSFPNDGANPSAAVVQASNGALYGTTLGGGDWVAGTLFRLSLPGVLSPAAALANGPGFLLTITGAYFKPGSTVLWNGAPRYSLTTDTSSQLHADIAASDLVSTLDISTAIVTVRDPDGCTSDPQLFTITSPSVGTFQSAIAPPNESVSVGTPNISDQAAEAAVTATVNNPAGSNPIAVTAATYAGNPTSSSIIDVGGGYVDLRIAGAAANVSATTYFYYPSSVTGATEDNLTLLYYTGTSWAPVLSSSGLTPGKDDTDNLGGTVSGGRFSVTFDQTSTPKVTELSGTVFASTVLDHTPPVITCPADIAVGCGIDLLVSVTFSATATDDWDPSPAITYSPASGSGFPIGTTAVTCTATDASGNSSTSTFKVTRAALGFAGFLPPIGGADATGGSFGKPIGTFKNGSTIPVKFTASCGGAQVLAGIHRLQVVKYSNATTAAAPIDATPQDAATTGNQFRLAGGQWQFNLDTKGTGMSVGIWQLSATLSDGSQHHVWIQLK
jgi:uncharacterized repeat protein (TIGR03803 family)